MFHVRVSGALLVGAVGVQPWGKSDVDGYKTLPVPVQLSQPLKQPTWYQKHAWPMQLASALYAADARFFKCDV